VISALQPALSGPPAALLANAASSGTHLAHAAAWAVFFTGATLVLAGALGVILLRNPVHCALMLVVTLFGVAVLFIDESADFLAAVQIIVYAGAIVILFLFVIMFLGVDKREPGGHEATRFQKPLAAILGLVVLVEVLVLSRVQDWTNGPVTITDPATGTTSHGFAGQLSGAGDNVQKLGQSIYTRYLLPFEMTAALLVIAVVAAVVLSRRQERAAGEMSRAEQEEVAAE
jgi:NADH-quinone oxidoreductase subunit J